ncbi:MAG: single-stranded DNA-binding protein [Aerococcus sp.]|nr:single-stranded DNA-binding protein [Aerococcus sp.]
MNQVELIGRLCRDIELKTTENGKAYCRNTLAIDRHRANATQTADFIPIVAFGKSAELMQRFVTKGDELAIVGHLASGQYTTKAGHTVYSLEVIVDRLTFLRQKNHTPNDDIPSVHVTLN